MLNGNLGTSWIGGHLRLACYDKRWQDSYKHGLLYDLYLYVKHCVLWPGT